MSTPNTEQLLLILGLMGTDVDTGSVSLELKTPAVPWQ